MEFMTLPSNTGFPKQFMMSIGTSSSARPRASGLDDHRPGVLLITSDEGHAGEPASVTVQRHGMTSSKLLSRTLAFQSSLRWPLERLHPHVLVSVTSGGGHDGEPALVTVQRAGMTSIKTPFPNTGIPKQFMIAIGKTSSTRPRASGLDDQRPGVLFDHQWRGA